MKVRLAAMLTAAIAAVLAGPTACSGTTSTPGAATSATIPLLRVGLSFPEATLDDTMNSNDGIDPLALETLLKLGPQGQLEPNLATSWTQSSPVSYVYHLRRGVRFWDGHPLTAADVAYSLNYDRAPASLLAYGFRSVKTIIATGQDTVTVTLIRPDATWQFTPGLEDSYIFEQQFQQAHQAAFGKPGTLVMGTGPWIVDSLDPIRGAQLSANPHWWGGTPPIQHISFSFYATETSRDLAFRAGEIDYAPGINDVPAFTATSGTKPLTTTSCDIAVFAMNVHAPGWDDVHVRRAVAYAINRTDLIAAHGGYATPLYTLTPPQLLRAIASQSQINALLDSIPLYPYDLAKARAEMAQSAYPHGFSTTILAYTYGSVPDVDQVIAAELTKIGIRAQVKPLPLPAWHAAQDGSPGSKRVAAFSGAGCSTPDPSAMNYFLGSKNTQPGGYNLADYAPPALDTVLAQADAATSPAQRFALYSRLFQQLQTDVPYVGLFYQDNADALSPKFTYLDYNPWNWEQPFALSIRPAAL